MSLPLPVIENAFGRSISAADRLARLRQRQEELLDEAIEATFPASDPIAFQSLFIR
jgi:hypothetical protein